VAVAGLVVAVFALIVAIVAAGYTRQQARAAGVTAANDTKRLHADQTPEFAVACEARANGLVNVTLELTGPQGLNRLDEVTISIRDDWVVKPPPGATPEQVAAAITGPYRFMAGIGLTDQYGRGHGPSQLDKHAPYRVLLEPTYPPPWVDPGRWRSQFDGQPGRLEITCRADGYDPWILQRDIGPKTALSQAQAAARREPPY
jgi:hypothetical protein